MGLRTFLRNRCTIFTTTATVGLNSEEIYQALARRRRRVIIEALHEDDEGTVSVSDLTRVIAADEGDVEPFDEDGYEACYVALIQSHLPVLESLDVIDWDQDRGVVRGGAPIPVLAEVVRGVEEISATDAD